MFWFKTCPKCQGDLYRETDLYGSYIACLQCSRYLTDAEAAQLELPAAQIGLVGFPLRQAEKLAA